MFSSYNSLSSISFENDPELTRVETGAFADTRLSLAIVPVSGSFVAGDAFPADWTVALAGGDLNAGFRAWSGRRLSGSSEAFEQRT
jgi:hypothetical protein